MQPRRVITCGEFWCRHELLVSCTTLSVLLPVFAFGLYVPPRNDGLPVVTAMMLCVHSGAFAYLYTVMEARRWLWHWRYVTAVIGPLAAAAAYHAIGLAGATAWYGITPRVHHASDLTFTLGLLTVLFVAMVGVSACTLVYGLVIAVRHLFTVPALLSTKDGNA